MRRFNRVVRGNAGGALLALCSVLVGCSGTDGESEAIVKVSDELYVETSHLWSVRNIPVCWSSSANALPTEKGWVREILHGQRSWAQVAGVRFKETSTPCDYPDSKNFQGVAINLSNTTSSMTIRYNDFPGVLVELRTNADVPTITTTCADRGLNREDCIKYAAVHELGHAIGFAHEHLRPDTPATCDEDAGGTPGDLTYGVWDSDSVMNYCSDQIDISPIDAKGAEKMYKQSKADVPRMGDFNADGRADLLCHDALLGHKWIAYSGASGVFGGSSSFAGIGTCKQRALYVGDVNGDARDDLICHDVSTGGKWVDFANSDGAFLGWDFGANLNWCSHETGRLLTGEFTGDGRLDLLCHDVANGNLWVDWAVGTSTPYAGTDWFNNASWCSGADERLFVGDFNGNGQDDLLCHDQVAGGKKIDWASGSGTFTGTNWSTTSSWCAGDTRNLHVGDFNADGRDDLLCHDTRSGQRWVDLANSSGQFGGTDATGSSGWCSHVGGRLYVGDFNNDDRDDVLCHDVNNGSKWVDYAVSGNVIFEGTDASWGNGWCGHDAGELH